MYKVIKSILLIALFSQLMVLTSSVASTSKALSKVESAVEVLDTAINMPENSIPISLLQDSEAIAVIPGVVKAGFVLGGQIGKGLISVRNSDRSWSKPNFIKLTGGSFGFQAGVQSTDIILVFKNKRSIDTIINGTFKLGADASVAAGPVGRQAGAGTNVKLQAEIYSYSRSRGLFAGIALDGSAITIDYDSNESVYGKEATPKKIFANEVASTPTIVVNYIDTLEEINAIKIEKK